MNPQRFFPRKRILLGASALVISSILFSCGPVESDSLSKAREFSSSDAARTAHVRLELPYISETPLEGFYSHDSEGRVRFVLDNNSIHLNYFEQGTDLWLILASAAIHLTPDDLTDTEYQSLRNGIGAFGMPLQSVPALLESLGREYSIASKEDKKGVVTAIAMPLYRNSLKTWIALQTGMQEPALDVLTPETMVIRLNKKSGATNTVEHLGPGGKMIARMSFDFDRHPSGGIPPFIPPEKTQIFGGREIMMASGAGMDWLIGKNIPEGNLADIDGRKIDLASLRGKPILLNFWATWCGPCRIEWPVLEELHGRFGKEVSFLLVTNEEPSLVKSYLKSNNYTAPVYLESDRGLNFAFGVTGIPATFLIDHQGVIRHAFVGFPRLPTIRDIHEHLKEKYESILSDMVAAKKKSAGGN